MITSSAQKLIIKDLGIDTYKEHILFLRSDCTICKAEGFNALTRLEIKSHNKHIIATLNIIHSDLLNDCEASLSLEAMKSLNIKNGDAVTISHLQPIESLGLVRAKIYKKQLDDNAFKKIIYDVAEGHYSNMELAAFVSACAGDNLTLKEIISLTKAMINAGNKIQWNSEIIFDKHCVGGLPGNRTTPIVVSIVAAAGLLIPKTSSRAITSPAGTADTMETITNVALSTEQIKNVINKENGCFAWGGAVNLSPADDILIAIERSLDIDSEGQMVASVLSKKVAAGSTHVVIDIPFGTTAKVRSKNEALRLQYYFKAVSEALNIHTEIIITDGTQPVGRGIGPALEAIDILQVLKNDIDSPKDLKERSIIIAAELIKMSGKFSSGTELCVARNLLENGTAYEKFKAICLAQGGFKEPVLAEYHHDVLSENDGKVTAIDNRKLARIAKLAGAPKVSSAGILFYSPIGKEIKNGDCLFKIYAESLGELNYAIDYLNSIKDLIIIE